MMEKNVYLDYNATTPIDPEVVNEMLPFIRTLFGNPSSSYSIGRKNKDAINQARNQVAGLINASPDEIIFTSGGTESNNHAIMGAAFSNRGKGKHIITSSIEHPSVMNVCNHLHSLGYEITYLPVDMHGKVSLINLEKAVRRDTVLITIMHANNEVGTIQTIKEIASVARLNNILFHTDAAQSAGKIEIDVKELGIDLLTIAGHKLYAPKGIGALFIKQGTKIENLIYGANQEKGYRPGTENVPYFVALGKACEIARRDFYKNAKIMLSTKERLINGLKKILGDRIKVNSELYDTLPNTLSVAFYGIEAHTLTSLIAGKGIFISAGSACHSDSIEISSVLKAMKIGLNTAESTVRISTGKYTTMDEIDHTIKIISDAVLNFSQKVDKQ